MPTSNPIVSQLPHRNPSMAFKSSFRRSMLGLRIAPKGYANQAGMKNEKHTDLFTRGPVRIQQTADRISTLHRSSHILCETVAYSAADRISAPQRSSHIRCKTVAYSAADRISTLRCSSHVSKTLAPAERCGNQSSSHPTVCSVYCFSGSRAFSGFVRMYSLMRVNSVRSRII